MSVGRANTGTFLAVKDVLLWERDARAGCCHRSKPRDEYAQVVISGLQVKVLSGVGQNVLLSTIGNVSLWEQNAQAGSWGSRSQCKNRAFQDKRSPASRPRSACGALGRHAAWGLSCDNHPAQRARVGVPTEGGRQE